MLEADNVSDTDDKLDIVEVTERSIEEKIRDFGDLLKDIESLDDNKRKLWGEIYENSIADRQNSYVMFSRLVKIVADKSTEHAVHGKTVATYIERMQKSNEQLIRLAELIAKAQRGNESIDSDDMFAQIQGKNQGR
jgi:hypothetical protein